MSYHHKQIEQVKQVEGQGSASGNFAEASINELMTDLSKKYGSAGQSLGQGGGNFAGEMGGGNFKKADAGSSTVDGLEGQLGSAEGNAIHHKKLEALSGEAGDVANTLRQAIGEGSAILKKMEGQGAGERATVLGKKAIESELSGGGEVQQGSFGQGLKHAEKLQESKGMEARAALYGMAATMGPVGWSAIAMAETGRFIDGLSARKDARSGMGEAIAQRSKMLNSYQAKDF